MHVHLTADQKAEMKEVGTKLLDVVKDGKIEGGELIPLARSLGKLAVDLLFHHRAEKPEATAKK